MGGWETSQPLLLEPDQEYRTMIHGGTPPSLTRSSFPLHRSISNPNLQLQIGVFNTLPYEIQLYDHDGNALSPSMASLETSFQDILPQQLLFSIGLDVDVDNTINYTYASTHLIFYPGEKVELYIYESQEFLNAPKMLFLFPERESYSNVLGDWESSLSHLQAEPPPPTYILTPTQNAQSILYGYENNSWTALESVDVGPLPSTIPDNGGGITPDGLELNCVYDSCLSVVQSSVTAENCSSLAMVHVSIELTHPFVDQDLGIALQAPDQTILILKDEDQSWSSQISLSPTLQITIGSDLEAFDSLSPLYESSAQGEWSILLWDDYNDTSGVNQELIDWSLLLWCN